MASIAMASLREFLFFNGFIKLALITDGVSVQLHQLIAFGRTLKNSATKCVLHYLEGFATSSE